MYYGTGQQDFNSRLNSAVNQQFNVNATQAVLLKELHDKMQIENLRATQLRVENDFKLQNQLRELLNQNTCKMVQPPAYSDLINQSCCTNLANINYQDKVNVKLELNDIEPLDTVAEQAWLMAKDIDRKVKARSAAEIVCCGSGKQHEFVTDKEDQDKHKEFIKCSYCDTVFFDIDVKTNICPVCNGRLDVSNIIEEQEETETITLEDITGKKTIIHSNCKQPNNRNRSGIEFREKELEVVGKDKDYITNCKATNNDKLTEKQSYVLQALFWIVVFWAISGFAGC